MLQRMEMAATGELLFSTMNVIHCAAKSSFHNMYSCRLDDGTVRQTDVVIGEKRALVCGCGDVQRACVFALGGSGARVRAGVRGGFHLATIESTVPETHIFVSSTEAVKVEDMLFALVQETVRECGQVRRAHSPHTAKLHSHSSDSRTAPVCVSTVLCVQLRGREKIAKVVHTASAVTTCVSVNMTEVSEVQDVERTPKN